MQGNHFYPSLIFVNRATLKVESCKVLHPGRLNQGLLTNIRQYCKWVEMRHDIQHNDTQYNDAQNNDTQHNDIQHNNK